MEACGQFVLVAVLPWAVLGLISMSIFAMAAIIATEIKLWMRRRDVR